MRYAGSANGDPVVTSGTADIEVGKLLADTFDPDEPCVRRPPSTSSMCQCPEPVRPQLAHGGALPLRGGACEARSA